MITSRANSHVKAARALGEAKERKRTGLFADEGEDALRAALAAGIAPVEAFVDDDLGSDRIADELAAAGTRVLRCTTEVMAALSSLSHASRAVGVLRANDLPPLVAGSPASTVGLLLYGVSDPGNLGTLLRSAQGFGPAHVALAEGCADPLSPRAVRASMGALYSVPVITLAEAPPLPVIALDARGERTLAELAPAAPVAFALGGERTGLPPEVTASNAVARIPLADGAESLNVAIAGALALYELQALADVDLVALAAVQRLAAEARLGRDHGQARLGAERAPFGAAAPLERHRDDTPGQADVQFEAALRCVPERSLGDALAPGDPAIVRGADVGRARLEDVEHEAASLAEQARRGAQRLHALRVAREVHERAEGRDHAVGLRQRRRIAQVADDGLDQLADTQPLGAPLRLGEHHGRGVECDHAVTVARELDRDAPAACSQLHDRAGRALADQHVERDVVVDPGAPAVIQRPQPLVRLTARCCCSHNR